MCKSCLINKQIVCTAQHDDQVIQHMHNSCWDTQPTVSWVCLYHVCKSPVAVSETTMWLVSVHLHPYQSNDLHVPFS